MNEHKLRNLERPVKVAAIYTSSFLSAIKIIKINAVGTRKFLIINAIKV